MIFNGMTDIVYKELDDNCYFGEIGFFSRETRCASAETMTFVNISYINIADFINIPNYYNNESLVEHINTIKDNIVAKNYKDSFIECYLCNSDLHISPFCEKIFNIETLSKFKFRNSIFKFLIITNRKLA
jgi:hypothetical protein